MLVKQLICNSTVFGFILSLLFASIPYQAISGQAPQNPTLSSTPTEWVKIVKPITGQKIVAGQGPEVLGESSDTTSKDCQVYVIVNNVKPYQEAFAMGPSGSEDFSKWRFTILANYTSLNEGENKITAKLSCSTPLGTRWYSIFVTGASMTINTTIPKTLTTPSNIDSTENAQALPTLEPKDSAPIPMPTTSSGISSLSSEENNQSLIASINVEKNPVSRGNNQSIVITVSDSLSNPISGAKIIGKLIYPGGNYEKDFDGMTDMNGKFLYSWTIGENGDLGALVVEVEVSSPGYEPQIVTSSFELVGPSNSSDVVDMTTTTSLDDKSITFQKDGFDLVAAGDYGCNAVTEEVVNKIKKKNPALVLAIGDLSEDKDPACFFDLFSGYDGQLKIALGEHDTDSSEKDDLSSRFSQFARHFELDQPYYSFVYENVHFLAMSTGKDELVPFGIGSPQYNFIANDLAQASENQDIDWTIVYGYRPFYSSPSVHPGPKSTRDIYHPLFEKYGVDLVISAHNHNYQRTYPLKLNAVSQSNPIVMDNNNSNYVNPNGPIFVTVGTAGNELYDLLDQYPFVVTQFKRNGFLDLQIGNNGTRLLTGSFIDSIDDNDGDSFTISKS